MCLFVNNEQKGSLIDLLCYPILCYPSQVLQWTPGLMAQTVNLITSNYDQLRHNMNLKDYGQ
jgi:hypothetical protein